MRSRLTYQDYRLGQVPGVADLARTWTADLVDNLLSIVWDAYDAVYMSEWSSVDWTRDYDDLERSLSESFAQAIADRLSPYAPVYVQHGPHERESRKKAPAQPPQYDIAFKLRRDPRIMWPIEAKVVKTDADTEANLGDYQKTLADRFLTGRYAPFTSSACMTAYLQAGDPAVVAQAIAKRIGATLEEYARFPSRPHYVSDHQRAVPAGKNYPLQFRCHHLVLPLD